MNRMLAGLLLLGCSFALAVEDESRPRANHLTPKEIAEGWILLFDGESTFGWRSPNDSKWTVADGMLAPQAGKLGQLTTTTAFLEYELSVDFLHRAGPSKVWISVGEQGKDKEESNGKILLAQTPFGGNNWTRLTVHVRAGEVSNPRFESISGLVRFATSTARPPRKAMPSEVKPYPITLSGNEVIFKNVKLKPLGTKPLFNGKDLSGWKEHPGKKSKFAVTDGLLTIKNGPGDLQSEGSWSDFLLQLECRTNGKNLNSGVFFRCRPGEYQQGYEAQIHNGFLDQPTKEYTIEEYDPKTNDLKDKRKIKSAAMDYGTGAIYRRIPAQAGGERSGVVYDDRGGRGPASGHLGQRRADGGLDRQSAAQGQRPQRLPAGGGSDQPPGTRSDHRPELPQHPAGGPERSQRQRSLTNSFSKWRNHASHRAAAHARLWSGRLWTGALADRGPCSGIPFADH